MLPSLVHSLVGQSSIRELCPPAYHELTADLLLPFCQDRIHTHTHRGPLLGNILQQIAIDRSKEMDGETHSAASQCRIWICTWVNLHQYWPIVPENLEACCNSRGNTFVQVRLSSGHKHAQTGRGREGGREQGQPATTKQRHNKQAEQRTEKGGGRGKKHTGTRPWHAEEQTVQSRTGNKAKTQQREGGKRRKKEKERKRTGRTREGDVPSPWPLSSVVSAWTSIGLLLMLLRSVELLRLMATSPCGYWFIVPHEVECLCHGRLLLLCSKDRRLQSCESSQLTRNMGKCPLTAINTLETGYVVEVLLIDLVLALKIPELLHP